MHDPYCVITKHITEMRDEKSNIVIYTYIIIIGPGIHKRRKEFTTIVKNE